MTIIKPNRFEGVVFHVDAVLTQAKKSDEPRLMPRIAEAFNFLTNKGYRLILATLDKAQTEETLKHNGLLHDAFICQGKYQIVEARQRPPVISTFDTKSYFDDMRNLGIENPRQYFAITASVDGIKSARATGITNAIGYYGSPNIEFGTALAHKDALERKGHALAGATQTMGNYAELPERLSTFPRLKRHYFDNIIDIITGCC